MDFRYKIELTKIPEITEEEIIMGLLGIEFGKIYHLSFIRGIFPDTPKYRG